MVSPASPLPKNPYSTPSEGRWHDAYDMCLKIEPALADPLEEDAVHARLLGYLILEAPTPAGRDYISEEILNCEGNTAKLSELVKFFVSSIMPVFQKRSYKFESNFRKFFNFPVEAIPRNHRYAKRAALSRDNYRCIITRASDLDYFKMLDRAEKAEILKEPGICGAFTIAWHIIPPLFAQGPECASTFILNYCSVPTELVQRAHDLTNILTLARNVASHLTRLDVWLEAIPGIENTYKVCSGMKMFRGSMPQSVTFSTDTGLPLPNPVYLRMHAALCRVAQFSGAADRAAFLACQRMMASGGEGDAEDDAGDDAEDERYEFEDSE